MNIDQEKTPVRPEREPLKYPVPAPRRRRPVGPVQGPNLSRLFKQTQDLRMNDEVSFHQGPRSRRHGHRLAVWSLLAAFIDALILISISCLFLIAFSAIFKEKMTYVVYEFESITSLQEMFLGVFVLSSWVYMITLRVLLGASIGEWACELRLGQPTERMRLVYVLQVFFRESLVVLTGIITLPLLSLIFGKDLSGKISGIQLFSLK